MAEVAGSAAMQRPFSLAESVAAVASHLPPALVAAAALQRVQQLADVLPPVAVGGFECRLGPAAAQVDLALYVPSSDPAMGILAGTNRAHHLAPPLLDDPVWQRIRNLCRSIHPPGAPLRGVVDKLWLEFDLPPDQGSNAGQLTDHAAPVPGLFFSHGPPSGTTPQAYVDVVDSVVDALGLPRIDAFVRSAILRATRELPAGAAVFQFGLRLEEEPQAVRLCISGLETDRLIRYLRDTGWSHDPTDLARTLQILGSTVDDVVLDIDVGATVQAGVGLEAHLRGPKRPRWDRRWDSLLDWMVAEGLCREPARHGLRAWVGTTFPNLEAEPSPDGLGALPSLVGGRAALCFLRGLHHVKVTHAPGGSSDAKAYIGFERHWVTTSPHPSVSTPPRVSDPPTQAGDAGRQERIARAVAAGIGYLEDSRTTTGWWTDFELADGISDAWVTAYTGWALANVPDPRADDLARNAWRLLSTRCHPSGGWGYHERVPPDADTTVWAILLAQSVGDPASARVGQAHAFLADHVRSGGVATYADAAPVRADMGFPSTMSYAGWTSPHACVTASAANLAGVGASFDPYLLRVQLPDGSWPAYWWADREYATWLAVAALASRDDRRGKSPSVRRALMWAGTRLEHHLARGRQHTDVAFPAACSLAALAAGHGRPQATGLIERAIAGLLALQLPDGSWNASARLRVPPTDCLDPEQVEEWVHGGRALRSVSLDWHRVFTTATTLQAVSAGMQRLARAASHR